ncbi:hypothetical protein PFISCL1PPCAC_27249, partial [Pristionchus fissidentatus]
SQSFPLCIQSLTLLLSMAATEDSIEQAVEAKEDEDKVVKRKMKKKKIEEEDESIDFPSNWTMKNLADHAAESRAELKHILEFGRMGLLDHEEQEHALEWTFYQFREMEQFRRNNLTENADLESEHKFHTCIREMTAMKDSILGYYRRRTHQLQSRGMKIKLKF